MFPCATVINMGGNEGDAVFFAAGSNVQPLGNLTIESGALNFSTMTTITADSLNMSGGDLAGSDPLDVAGLLTWTGGTMAGSGSTVAKGGLALGLANGSYHQEILEARTLINQATANWVGSGEIDLFSGATFVNLAGATFNEKTNDTIWSDIGVGLEPAGLFDNRGTFVVEGGGTATMEATFDNEGQVDIISGTWVLSGDGSSPGSFTINGGAALKLNKFYGVPYTALKSGAFVSSPLIIGGTKTNVTLIAGSQTLPAPLGATVAIPEKTAPYTNFFETGNDTISSLDMTGGWLTLTGTLTVTGPMIWTGGYIAGPGTLVVEGGLQLGTGAGDQQQQLHGATLINQGTLTLTDKDSFSQESGATVVNQAGATIDIDGDANWVGDDTGPIDNEGMLEKTAGSGSTKFTYSSLVNTGSVSVSSGTLDLETGGTATGSFTAAAGGTLDFGQASWAFNAGSSVTGAGTVEFPFAYWGSVFGSGSTYDVSGATQLQSQAPVVFLSGSTARNFGALTLKDGTLELESGAAASAASLTELSGVLTGSDTLAISGQTTWTGGSMSGTGATVTDGGLQLGAPGATLDAEILAVRTLDDAGGGTLQSHDALEQAFGSVFSNPASATLNLQQGASWQTGFDGTSTIDNQGTLIVAAGSGKATISGENLPFLDNTGEIEVSSGELRIQTAFAGDGSYLVLAGAVLAFGNDQVTTASLALPSELTAGPIDWTATFSGSAQDNSGSGLASVGLSLFNGTDYYNGTAFVSKKPVFNAAELSGLSWAYTITAGKFTAGLVTTDASAATAKNGASDPSTITSLLISPS